ncbi:hypothetical protein [Nocardia sp. IFM 10818]
MGLSAAESWGLLEELVKTVRLQGAMTLLPEVDIKQAIFEPRNTRIRIRSMDSDRTRRIISWLPGGRPGTTNNRILFARKVLAALDSHLPADKLLDGCWRFLVQECYVVLERDKFAGDVYQVDHEQLRIRATTTAPGTSARLVVG